MMSTPADLAKMRQEYGFFPLLEIDLAMDWPGQFGQWFDEAVAFGLPEPNAMIVATAAPDAHPSARTVLLKGFDQRGFTFFTNYDSRKGREIELNPFASLVFPWLAMHRQVVVCGEVQRVDRAETEAYFQRRPRGAQIGAWASTQSEVLPDRAALDRAYAEADAELPDVVPAPPHWADCESCRRPWNFGRAGQAGCTTDFDFDAPDRSGRSNVSPRKVPVRDS